MSGGGLRLFVAADPPAGVREQLAGWGRVALGVSGLRLAGSDRLHITVCFVGPTPAAEVEQVARLALGCARPVTGLELGGPLLLPARRPRVVAVSVLDTCGELEALHDEVADALSTGLGVEAETRRFRPHITVARMRPGDGPRAGGRLPPTPDASFAAQALTLYRSRLEPEGARYEPLERVALA